MKIFEFKTIVSLTIFIMISFTPQWEASAAEIEKFYEYETLEGRKLITSIKESDLKTSAISIRGKKIYVPYPRGERGIVGQYECSFFSADAAALRKMAVKYFLEHDLLILFSRGSNSTSIVLGLSKETGASKFVAYRAEFIIQIFPDRPTQGRIEKCDIIVTAHGISGKITNGRRNIKGASIFDDQVSQGLMSKVSNFVQRAGTRAPKLRHRKLRFRIFKF